MWHWNHVFHTFVSVKSWRSKQCWRYKAEVTSGRTVELNPIAPCAKRKGDYRQTSSSRCSAYRRASTTVRRAESTLANHSRERYWCGYIEIREGGESDQTGQTALGAGVSALDIRELCFIQKGSGRIGNNKGPSLNGIPNRAFKLAL